MKCLNLTFNGVSMFANRNSEQSADAVFDDMSQNLGLDNTMSILSVLTALLDLQ